MTSIKKLVMRGFKSFAKRTEIPFENNFSCILGANGSGKSNVVDALCFVLGTTSAKTLRAEKSANLIYNGGKEGKPHKEAEVSVVFSNDNNEFPLESKEVMISRIVRSNGNSIYKINNETRTRQQVVDILGHARINPDGHSIILQGDIIHFTDMKTTDRRLLVDDIAGISIYEDKKAKAMQELEKVHAKLNEADIILTERQKTLSELKKDRDQAIVFKEKEEMMKRSKATLLSLMLKDKEERKAEIDKKNNDMRSDVEKMKKEVEELKAEKEKKYQEIQNINTEMDTKGNVKQQEIGRDIEKFKEDTIKAKSRIETCDRELKKLSDRKKQLEKEIKDIDGKIAEKNKNKEAIQFSIKRSQEEEAKATAKIETWKRKHGIADNEGLSTKIQEMDKDIEELQKEILDWAAKKQECQRAIDQSTFELKTIEAENEKLQDEKVKNKEKLGLLKQYKGDFADTARKLADALNENSVYASQLGNARKQQMEENEMLSKLRLRSAGIREIASHDAALQKIKAMNISGVYGCVSELGTVSSKYSMALEVAAGQKLKSVVVNTDATAAKCIDILKESRTGVLTFLPMNKLRERALEPEALALKGQPGVHGLAIDFVKHDPKFSNVFKYVFGATLIIDNVEAARRLGIGRARMATLDGDLMETSGAMIGGYRKASGLGFRENELSDQLGKAEESFERLSAAVSNLEKKKEDNDELIAGLRERKASLQAQIQDLEKTLGVVADVDKDKKSEITLRLSGFNKEMKEIEAASRKADEEKTKLSKGRQELQQQMAEATNPLASEELEKLEKEKQAIKESIMRKETDIRGLDAEIGVNTAELEKIKGILSSHDKEKEDFSTEMQQKKQEFEEKIAKVRELSGQQKSFYTEYNSLFKRKDRIKNDIVEIDSKIIRKEEKTMHLEEQANDVAVRAAELSGEIAGAMKEFEEYKDVQLRRGISMDDLNAEMKSFERELKNMGNVNLRALEVYEKANEECKNLLEKCETLKSEKEQVLAMMYEIDTKKKDAFMKSYTVLLKNFREIFATLSTKGEANLILENEENPFEGGLGIAVRIGSNKFLDIKSLSGGEKTLAALAFIFAIQEFDPAPFYLLDEVDAALDKRNSELLSGLIAKYSSRAQYITISHNDNVINEAEAIYGVSMQDGVSKVVSLKI